MEAASSLFGQGIHVPSPVMLSIWDRLAILGVFLAVWFIVSFIVKLPDNEEGEDHE